MEGVETGCRVPLSLPSMIKKNSTTQAIRATGHTIFAEIAAKGKQSLRTMGKLVGRSKSSVHRHLKALAHRNRHPESEFWETEAGAAWLRLLALSVLYSFGLQHHVGADTLSDFFKLIRIDTHAGFSPGALRTQLRQMEALLPAFQQSCEASAPPPAGKAVVAADETFFGELLILVLMDLSPGYLLLETIQGDRSFDTWFAQAGPRLDAMGIRVGHAVSDRAKALHVLARCHRRGGADDRGQVALSPDLDA